MSKLEKQTTLFVNYNALKKIYTNGKKVDYSTMGLELNQKIALNKFMFSESKVIKRSFSLLVNKSTYNSEKSVIIDYIVEDVIIKMKQCGRRDRTISAEIGEVATFVDWADAEKIDFLKDIVSAQKAFSIYTSYLKFKIRDGSYAQGTAAKKHSTVLRMFRGIHNDTKNVIASGIKMIHRGSENHTEKSLDKDKLYHFNFYSKLFNEVSDFILNDKKYPYKLSLYSSDVWIIPQRPMFLTGYDSYYSHVFDHLNGKLRSAQEMYDSFAYKNIASATNYRREFIRKLNKNNNIKTSERLVLATVALRAYYILFITITGMNDSTAATLPWKNEYLVEKEQHKFKNIKYRANGKVVEFPLEKKFVKVFQKFIKLREFILDGYDCKYLFFTGYGEKSYLSIIQERGNFVKDINNYMVKKIDPNLPKINARELRLNKGCVVREEDGLMATSISLQSSQQTVNRNYAGVSDESAGEEMTQYYNAMNKNIICSKDEGIDISIGQCLSIDKPKSMENIDGINVDCKQAEGCLFCDKFSCHADEIDIRKLHSLSFIIEESRSIAKDEKHFLSVYKAVLGRIENIFHEIGNVSKSMKSLVNEIKKDVFEFENLDPYWEHKLTTLIDMGVLK